MLVDEDYRPFVQVALPLYFSTSDSVEVRLLSLSENATYLVFSHNKTLVFRVHRSFYHDVQEIKSEQEWVVYIGAKTQINTPQPISNIHGDTVSTITIGDETKNISVCSFIPGSIAEEADNPISYSKLGYLTAKMHILSENFTPSKDFTRFSWDIDDIVGPNARWGDWHNLAGLIPEYIDLIERAELIARQRVHEYGKSTRVYGIIHSDLRMSNVIVGLESEDLTIIDFDDCGWSWYLYDLASVLSFQEERPDACEIIDEWIKGYTSVRLLSMQDLAMIPTFVILRRIQLAAWIASHSHSTHAQLSLPYYARNTAILVQKYLKDSSWLKMSCL